MLQMLSSFQTRFAFSREEVGTQEELTPGSVTAGQAVTAAGIVAFHTTNPA